MEIEPFLIASSVELVIAQRLIRRLCTHCADKRIAPTDQVLSIRRMLDLPVVGFESATVELSHPAGCEWCRGMGYRGRVGLFEILQVQKAAHDLVLERASSKRIREAAMKDGMRSLQESAWDLMVSGVSSPEEALRHVRTMDEESGE
jgi:type II secretory ATPase GspE/PulE/Tfp pilus assembly ATPase PilB-like protein